MTNAVVAAAELWLGTPYRHRASTRGAGCDCLGLLRGVWRDVVGTEPEPMPPYERTPPFAAEDALERAASRWLVRARGKPAAGDVVLFALHRGRPARHCAILIAPNRFIHAQERLGVVAADMTEAWARRVSARFVFPV